MQEIEMGEPMTDRNLGVPGFPTELCRIWALRMLRLGDTIRKLESDCHTPSFELLDLDFEQWKACETDTARRTMIRDAIELCLRELSTEPLERTEPISTNVNRLGDLMGCT